MCEPAGGTTLWAMAATYTFEVFSTLDGFGGYDEHGDWGGYWGKGGPEFLERRLTLCGTAADAAHRGDRGAVH